MLILTYAVGMSHELIPHCHTAEFGSHDDSQHSEQHHEHHDNLHHDTEIEVDHSHSSECVTLTEDWLCYIICLLSELEHPSSDFDVCFYVPNSINKIKDNWLQISLFAVFVLDSDSGEAITLSDHSGYAEGIIPHYASPPLSGTPHRGPPLHTC